MLLGRWWARREAEDVVIDEEPEQADPEPLREPEGFETLLYRNRDGARELGIDPDTGYRGGNPLEALNDEQQIARWIEDRGRERTTLREEGVDFFEGLDASEHDPTDQHGSVAAKREFKRRQKKKAKQARKDEAKAAVTKLDVQCGAGCTRPAGHAGRHHWSPK